MTSIALGRSYYQPLAAAARPAGCKCRNIAPFSRRGKSTPWSFKLLQKNDRRDPLNPRHALCATGFSYTTISWTLTNTHRHIYKRRRSEIEFTTFSGLAKDSTTCVRGFIYIYIYARGVYGQFVWDLIIARILFRPRISLGTGLAVPIVSHNTASSLYIFSRLHAGMSMDIGHIYIYLVYIRVSFHETFRPSGWAAVNLLYDWKNLSICV